MEAICAGMGGDGDRVQRGRLEMDAKFAGTVGDGDKLSSPRSSLVSMLYFADVFNSFFYGRLSWPNG